MTVTWYLEKAGMHAVGEEGFGAEQVSKIKEITLKGRSNTRPLLQN